MPNTSRQPRPWTPQPVTASDIRAAHDAGMTFIAWCDAGRPRVSKAATRPEIPGKTGISVRPWHPYRSKWEADYARYLESLQHAKLIAGFEYEPEKLEIGVGAKYTPDFRVTRLDGSREWREVKGYRREAAMVRIKAAALRFPNDRFVLVTKADGQWKHTMIGAAR
jgi:hypothetical protein